VPLASSEVRNKLIVIFHDESTFNANDDQTLQWGVKGEGMLRPKSKGSGIMVSEFIEERTGYLALTTKQYKMAKVKDKTISQFARETLEYGESRDGYLTSDKFMKQLEKAVKIAEFKYPISDGWKIIWIFDHSSCHTAMSNDASRMNVKPGGKQPRKHDTFWSGEMQSMVDSSGVPKGMRLVLQERGICTDTLVAEDMRIILRNHPDFQNEKPRIISFIKANGHRGYFLPKFHPELNPIERNWGQAKRYSKAHCNYSLISLRKVINPSLDFVTLDNMKKYFRKARDTLRVTKLVLV
jgi:transposase